MEPRPLQIALTLSITGLLILVYVAETVEPPCSTIGDIDAASLGKNIHISGNITDLHTFRGGSISLVLYDGTGETKVYLPYSTATKVAEFLAVGGRVDLIGTVEVYQGDVEVVVENPDSLRQVK